MSSFVQFPSTLAAIQDGIKRRLHTGVQIYVSVAQQPQLNAGFGTASSETDFNSSTITLWRSAGKPMTAAAVMKLIERGRLKLDSTLAELLQESRETVLADITIGQLLTHSSGIPIIDTGWPQGTWSEILSTIFSVQELHAGAAYQPQATWFLLGEILCRLDENGRSFPQLIHDEILQPLHIDEVACGLSDLEMIAWADRLPLYWDRDKGQLVPSSYAESPWLTVPSPGGNFRGPVRQLGRFYEMLMNDGTTVSGDPFLMSESVRQMTSRHRTGKFDQTLQHIVDFGLGLIINSNGYGVETVPYGFGRYCSDAAFGHGGSQCAMGFCDPERRLVVAWAANGFCGEGQHQRRNRAINEAIYRDLGMV